MAFSSICTRTYKQEQFLFLQIKLRLRSNVKIADGDNCRSNLSLLKE